MAFTTIDMTWLKNRLDKILARKETDVNCGSVFNLDTRKCGIVTIDHCLQFMLYTLQDRSVRKKKDRDRFQKLHSTCKGKYLSHYRPVLVWHLHWAPFTKSNLIHKNLLVITATRYNQFFHWCQSDVLFWEINCSLLLNARSNRTIVVSESQCNSHGH